MDQLHNGISGLFIAAQGIGETLGPILGSVFEYFYTFRPALDLLSAILFGFMILYFVVCGRMEMFTKFEAVENHYKTQQEKVQEPLLTKENSNDTDYLDHKYSGYNHRSES